MQKCLARKEKAVTDLRRRQIAEAEGTGLEPVFTSDSSCDCAWSYVGSEVVGRANVLHEGDVECLGLSSCDFELRQVIAGWNALSAEAKAEIMLLIQR